MSDQLVALQGSSPAPQTPSDKVRFHLSMNVSSIPASVAFFETFFGCPPAKLRDDYAKFEIQEPADSVWSHRLGQPIPSELYVRDSTVDKIHLQGTLNATCSESVRTTLFNECYRGLKPSGTMMLHQLTSDQPIAVEQLQLPGAASVVQQVLPIGELMDELRSAGFKDVSFDKYGKRPCFVRDGIELRETMLTAHKQSVDAASANSKATSATCRLLFKGAADQVTVGGITLSRGRISEIHCDDVSTVEAVLGEQVIVFGNG